ncbi:DUF2891 domain-containing protein [Amycolatopsis sp. FU40]|uniref:DUF2891 domain-containing protein n=1 Tax=Amycolatopsis sp. FU40 TaxID=2914159 RepID=UPI001F2E04BB|nr:DUF2891 domain-containing protein [Amycolatopsis sp. FU40]UKD55265.1 DUF2891 domain-containing protein [Amycolatopsis sp. FU40]
MAGLLAAHAGEFAEVALTNVVREYPHYESHWRVDETPVPAIRELHPCFYGSFDWHSCVEMFWVLAHLLRRYPSLVPAGEIRAVLNAHLTEPALAAEAAYFAPEHHRTTQRPYGWSILLALTFETATWDDPDAARWSAALQPLSRLFVTRFLDWLPKVGYPIRYGLHENGAFGLSRTLPYADYLVSRGEPQLREVITETAWRWFGSDRDYPGAWEPSGADFLTPALAEAELMSRLMPAADFGAWLEAFLPGIADRNPAALFTPAVVTDASDGLIAHLHGLNLHRAWCWQRIAAALPEGDDRGAVIEAASREHADASLTQVTEGPYAVEHFLAYYALLLLSDAE